MEKEMCNQLIVGVRLRLNTEAAPFRHSGVNSDFTPLKSLSFDGLVNDRKIALKAVNAFFDEYEELVR